MPKYVPKEVRAQRKARIREICTKGMNSILVAVDESDAVELFGEFLLQIQTLTNLSRQCLAEDNTRRLCELEAAEEKIEAAAESQERPTVRPRPLKKCKTPNVRKIEPRPKHSDTRPLARAAGGKR